MGRKSFIIHLDSLDILDEMTDEQAGKLAKAWKAYHKGEELDLEADIKMAFIPFRNQFVRDEEKYVKIVERNRKNGSLGGRPENEKDKKPKNPPKPKEPKETEKTQSVIPEYEEFYNYAVSNAENLDNEKIELKYKSWKENDWKDGHNVKIKNWKTKLLNTLQYLKNDKGSSNKNATGVGSTKSSATYNRSNAIDTAQTLFSGGNSTTKD